MIKDSQKTDVPEFVSFGPSLSKGRSVLPALRGRRLRAIEIAEGALLADIGVIFQLLVKFLPIVGVFFQMLVPVLFAVIVLRRGFYVGCMSLCVALFVVCIVIGPGGAPFMVLEAGAGIFLGLTMRQRLGHLLTIVLGVLGGGLALWFVLLFYVFVSGGPTLILRTMHQGYAAFTNLAGLVFSLLHLGSFWQGTLFPLIDPLVTWGFQHWLVLYYVLACVICVPLVLIVYLVVNVFLRLLGYPVRPFPGYLLEGWLYACARILFKLVPRRALRRFPALSHLKREVRRLNIERLRQRRLAREARGKG